MDSGITYPAMQWRDKFRDDGSRMDSGVKLRNDKDEEKGMDSGMIRQERQRVDSGIKFRNDGTKRKAWIPESGSGMTEE